MTDGTRTALALIPIAEGAVLVAGAPTRPDVPERRAS
ncbi:hypothetical protein SFIMM107S_04895 [Streptomyces griseus]